MWNHCATCRSSGEDAIPRLLYNPEDNLEANPETERCVWVDVNTEGSTTMRIGINASLLAAGGGYRRTGVSRYIGELIDALEPLLGPSDELAGFGRRFPALARRPALRIMWEQAGLPLVAAARGVDVFHGPLNVAPLAIRVPTVVTVHDLAFLHHPSRLPPARRAYMIAATRLSVGVADRVIAVSERTADDLAAWLPSSRNRITVIPEAPSASIERLTGSALDEFRSRAGIARPYVLAVGTLEPRKNLPFLLRAFAAVSDRFPHDLILVGPEGWMTGELHRTLERLHLGDRIRMTGFVSDRELGGWYSGADLFTFPSTYEGFGLPSVEAMHCGAPLLVSDSSCFPEVVGDAGMLVSPTDAPAWSEALVAILTDRALNDHLRDRSLASATRFSWERTATETLRVYREIAR